MISQVRVEERVEVARGLEGARRGLGLGSDVRDLERQGP